MSHLLLVRHGQASFLEPDYDKLSQKGEAQSRLLGEYWGAHRIAFDRVYSGPRVRQRETERLAREAYRKSGMRWPEVEVLDQFDEFRAEAVMEQSLPKLVGSDAHIFELHRAFQAAAGKDEKFKTFQKIFEVVIARWARGELPVEGIEPWPEFCTRVRAGLARLTGNGSRGQRIVIFTSGGPVGVAIAGSLAARRRRVVPAAQLSGRTEDLSKAPTNQRKSGSLRREVQYVVRQQVLDPLSAL